jgi:hypothetical protein
VRYFAFVDGADVQYASGKLMLRLIFILSAILLFSVPAHAQLKNENLLVAMPDGYIVGFQDKNAKQQMTEMVPRGQSVKDWTDMVTVQIFFNMTDVTPDAYKQRLEKLWAENCKGAESSPIGQGNERGYPVIVWLQYCPLNKDTGKPEVTLLKGDRRQGQFLRRAEGVPVPTGQAAGRAMVALPAQRLGLR